MKTKSLPTNLLEAVRYFSDPDVRPNTSPRSAGRTGPVCLRCGGLDHSLRDDSPHVEVQGVQARSSRSRSGRSSRTRRSASTSGSPPSGWSPTPRTASARTNSAAALGVTQKSAWFMLHRIRLAMQNGTLRQAVRRGRGRRDLHRRQGPQHARGRASRRQGIKRRPSEIGKAAVIGLLERGGTVRAQVVPDTKRARCTRHVRETVEPGTTVYTDALPVVRRTRRDYAHETVDHAEPVRRRPRPHQRIENFWSLLKRGLHGTYVSVEPFHLFRYLDERMFTFNQRDLTDRARFDVVLRSATGRRLTFREVTGKA